jgi:hypothetical protein
MQVEAFFKKNKSFSDEERCRAAAISSFERGEKLCRIANRRLEHYFFKRDRLDPDLEKYMSRMERDLHRILGDHDTFLDKLPGLVRVTAGATSTKSRRESLPHLRVSKRPYANPSASKYLNALSEWFGYGRIKVKETLANRVEFVPKNWKTHRSIACEPEGNVFLQLAFDTYVKRRLRRIGINLSDQSKNQELAREGSVKGNLATIDLSMASDTLSFNAVAWLLPRSWFNYINSIRCTRSRGEVSVEYAKFSSMGNGCTFGLETLVFASACRAVGSKRYSVYGDDIIIETELVEKLKALLQFIGFQLNTDKSFTEGPFRESCGSNWFSGIDITPVYVREIDSRKAMICHLVNSLATIAIPEGDLWKMLLGLTAEYSLPLVPFNENSTSGIWVDIQTARKLKLIRNSIKRQPFTPKFKSYVPVAEPKNEYGMRSLFLWYLDTLGRGQHPAEAWSAKSSLSKRYLDWYQRGNPPAGCVCRSRYTISSHRYRRKWVHWREPVVSVPLHIHMWSDSLSRV